MKKFSIAFVVIIIFVGGYILFTRTGSDSTSSEQKEPVKTYTNSALGYAIDYPLDWTVSGSENDIRIEPPQSVFLPCEGGRESGRELRIGPLSHILIREANDYGPNTLENVRDGYKREVGGKEAMVETTTVTQGGQAFFYTGSDSPQCPGQTKSENLYRAMAIADSSGHVITIETHNYQLPEVQAAFKSFRFLPQ